MSKKTWFVLILLVAIIGILILRELVAEFDPWMQNNVLGPAWNGILGIGAAITSNPFYQDYAFQLGAATAFTIAIVFALILWPKIRTPTKKATTTLQDKIRTTPTQIPATPQPTPVATTPAAPADAVEAEE